jgi:hypothetical protein
MCINLQLVTEIALLRGAAEELLKILGRKDLDGYEREHVDNLRALLDESE